MPDIKMDLIEEPPEGTRTVLIPEVAPVFRGEGAGKGDVNYLCGRCSTILIETMPQGSVRNIVIKCPKCGSFNEV